MPDIPPEIVEKYRSVERLYARATTAGERAAAKAGMARMERSYPGIGIAAAATPRSAARSGPGSNTDVDYAELFKVAFGAATDFFDWLHSGVAAAELRQQIEDTIDDGLDIKAKPNRSGSKIAVIIELDTETIDDLLDMAEDMPGARSLAAEIIGEKAREGFDALLVELLAQDQAARQSHGVGR